MDEKKLNVNISPDIAQGKYVNMEIVTHTQNEFVFDFGQLLPGIPGVNVVSRIIVTPEHAKKLLAALKENIDKYESDYGSISAGASRIPMGFNISKGDA